MKWRPLGDRENNKGTVQMNADPAASLVERITNMFDTVLDLEARLHPEDHSLVKNPGDAARRWLGVPATGLADMSDKARREAAERVQIILAESGERQKPTIITRDKGAGLTGASMPGTIMSLNAQNKVGVPWAHGTFGQGGSTTYASCEGAVILTRRDPRLLGDGEADEVSLTVVRKREPDATQKTSWYGYLVDASADTVLTFPARLLPDFQPGTMVTHIEYDIQSGLYTAVTSPTGIWMFLNNALFDPNMPFLLASERSSDKDSRVITGNATRLARPERARGDIEIPHLEPGAVIPLGDKYGHVTLKYWVVRKPLGSRSTGDPLASYVTADSAIALTLFGQRQGNRPRRWLKDQMGLPFLYKGMVVQIEGDGLTILGRDEVFSATRENARKSSLVEDIYTQVAALLSDDERLKELDEEERQRRMRHSTHQVNEKLRRKLGSLITTVLPGTSRPSLQGGVPGFGGVGIGGRGKGRGTSTGTGGGPKNPRSTDDSMFGAIPTYLRFNKDSITMEAGARSYVSVEIDAKNNYLPTHDEDLLIQFDPPLADKVRCPRSALAGGHMRFHVITEPDVAHGKYLLTLSLAVPTGLLTDTLEVVVTKPVKEEKGSKGGTEPDTGPELRWVFREEWDDHDMNADKVGYVAESPTSVTIFVNRHYRALEKFADRPGITEEVSTTRTERYQLPVALELFRQEQAWKALDVDGLPDSFRDEEMERVAEAVIFAIDPDAGLEDAE